VSVAFAQFESIRLQAILPCREPADVVEALAHARRSGAALAIRSRGHCFAGRSSTDGILIDVSPIDAVAIGDGDVSIGAGARLGAIYDAAPTTMHLRWPFEAGAAVIAARYSARASTPRRC
jgi:FAD/FMN-containing dehydrogenase